MAYSMPDTGIGRFLCRYAAGVFIALIFSLFSKIVTKALIPINYFPIIFILFWLASPEWFKEKWTWTFAW
jgi:hypothetical protein